MFAEMLTHSEEKIFLEAIDQYFENEYFEDMKLENSEILPENIIKNEKKETESSIDEEKETDIEIMNIKFYEALNKDNNNEIKDISTDFESEDNNINPEKHYIKISDCLILTKESIAKIKTKLYDEYKRQIILEEKIKNLFKNNKIDDYKDKTMDNNRINNKNDIKIV